jgi:hypothetical protein
MKWYLETFPNNIANFISELFPLLLLGCLRQHPWECDQRRAARSVLISKNFRIFQNLRVAGQIRHFFFDAESLVSDLCVSAHVFGLILILFVMLTLFFINPEDRCGILARVTHLRYGTSVWVRQQFEAVISPFFIYLHLRICQYGKFTII